LIKLSDYIRKENIVCSLGSDLRVSVNTLITSMIKDREPECSLNDFEDKFSDLITIDLKNGFLISHSRRNDLKNIHVGLITFEKKTYYKKMQVKAVFCILVPNNMNRAYLSILAHISRLFSRPKAEEIFSCDNVDKIIDFVKEMEG